MATFLKLNDISSYKKSFALSNLVWERVQKWDFLARDTVGKQFIRSVDSISANIAEGFGRYYKKDKILYYRYSFGSVYESLDWNEKAVQRKLLTQDDYAFILAELTDMPRELNTLIKYTNEKLAI